MVSSWDQEAFLARWREVYLNDPEYKQHVEEWRRQRREKTRFGQEAEVLWKNQHLAKDEEERKVISRELDIAETKSQLTDSRQWKVNAQKWQRAYELRLELLAEYKDAPGSQVEEVQQEISRLKDSVKEYESRVNEQQRKISQLLKEAQKILADALKQGYVLLQNFIALMVGTPGVGKTCLKCLLMGRKPPDARTSTICAEHPIKIRSLSSLQFRKLRGKWKEASSDMLLPMISRFIRRNVKKLGVEIPPELNAYLELLEGSATAAAGGKVAASSTALSSLASLAGKSPREGELGSSTLQNEAAALDEMVESVLGSLEKLIAGEELSEEEEDELMSSVWIYFTDSGGQPQFHELLPLFIHDVSSIIIVTRLSDRLEDHPPDEYYQDGQCVGKKSSTHLTTTEQIKCLTSSLLSRSSDEVPDIIMVGTHRDKAHECPESIEEKNEKLLKIFGPELRSHLMFFNYREEKLLHPVNTIKPNDFDKSVADMIRVSVETSKLGKEVKVPIWWFILELLIQGLAKKLGKRVLSKEQCVKIANTLGFTERSFNAALKFFNELNIIKYSPALPEVVFVDSQVPLDNVSDLVRERYHGFGSFTRRGNWERFCKEGVVTLEFVNGTCKHFERGIFESPQLLKLLQNQLVVVPLEPLSDISLLFEADEYFMPALLDVLSREELNKHRIFSSPAAPLLFRFPCGCRRAGVFCCLVVHLMKKSKWSIQHINKKVILVARNCVTFRLPKHSCLVTLIDAFYFFEVHIAAQTKASVCQEMCPIIRKEILAGIEAASEKLHYSNDRPEVGAFCSCQGDPALLPQNVRHAALVQESGACTCVETSVSNHLDERSTIWLDQEMVDLFSSADSAASSQSQPRGATAVLASTGQSVTATRHSTSPSQGRDDSTSLSQTTSIPPANTQPIPIPYYESQVQLKHLNLIKWNDGSGETQRFYLMENISPDWQDIGELIGLPVPTLKNIATKHRDEPLKCCRDVLGHWLENPPSDYPITWRGLIELLKDCKLGQIVSELESVLSKSNLE